MRVSHGAAVRAVVGASVAALAVWRSADASQLADRPLVGVVSVASTAFVAAVLPAVQERLAIPGAVPVLLGVTLFSIYACVPETDQIPQVAAAVVVLLALEVGARRPLWWGVVVAVCGWVTWSGLFGATGRASALVGTLFALWPLVLVSTVVAIGRGSVWRAAVAGSSAAVAVARTGALQPEVAPAYLAVALALAASITATVAGRQDR